MDSFTINLATSVKRDLRKIDHQAVPRISAAIDGLADDPRPVGCRKLTGSLYTYRIRVGDYRIIYTVDDDLREILVQRVRHRKEAYQ